MSQGDCETYAIKEFAREFHRHAAELTKSILCLAEAVRHHQENGNGPAASKADLLASEHRLTQKLEKIMAAIDDANAALAKIDGATTKIATNIQAEADIQQKISDELDVLIANAAGQGVPAAFVTSLQGVADRVQASSDALDANVPVLQGIATKGAQNPVPVPVPPPSPTP